MKYFFDGSQYKQPFTRWLIYCGIFATALLAIACGNGRKSSEQTVPDEGTAETTREEVLKTLGGHAITGQLHDLGSGFQKDALHDITLVPHYLQLGNQGAAAANLGVYMSDLGYLTDFDQRDEAKRYFEGCLVLANHIGMGQQFGHAVELRFSEILTGNEDLKITLDRLFDRASSTASGDNFKKLHAAALTGYYIEELYHLVMIEQLSNNNPVAVRLKALQTLINQKSGVNNLVGYYDHLQLKPEGIVVYQEFLRMQSNYLVLDAKRLQNETDPVAILADKNFQEIASSIVSIRNSITGI